jgi:hypothetical protein
MVDDDDEDNNNNRNGKVCEYFFQCTDIPKVFSRRTIRSHRFATMGREVIVGTHCCGTIISDHINATMI